MRVRSAFVVVALTGLAVAAPARMAAAQAGKTIASVRIEFRALTEDGQQVPDLKLEEVALKVNGKPRQIKSLSLVRGDAEAATGGTSPVLPPPFATNTVGSAGRIVYILLDDDSISPGREGPTKDAVRMIASELAPGDQLGLLSTLGQLNIRPVDDVTKVRLAVEGFAGRAFRTETDADAQCRTKHVLGDLGSMLQLTSSTAPTTIVIFSGGMSPPAVKQVVVGSRTGAGTTDVCPVTPDDYQNIGSLAATAHADLYLFHMTEAMVNRSTTLDAGFESLAGVTGAEFVRVTAGPQTAVSRMLRETAAYYTATFDPDAGERGAQSLRVDLRSSRDKVRLRSRPAVAIPKTETAVKTASPKDMLRTPAEYRDLPLRAAGYASSAPGSDDVTVVALFEGIDPAVPLASASVGLFDEKNTLKKQWTAQGSELAKRPVMAALTAPPGFYRLRVAAIDASGRAGTTDVDLKADATRADPLKLSALVLGTQPQGGGFAPRLQFDKEPIAIGLVEIYGVPRGGTVTVDLDVTTTPDGAPLATAQTTVNPGRAEDSRTAFGGFNISTLAPGDYLMRAVVKLDGKPVGKVVRTLRKTQ